MTSPLKKVIDNTVTQPQSLQAERNGASYFIDEYGRSIPNEGNFLSLLTLKQFYKDAPEAEKTSADNAINAIAKEENRYLLQAMKVLTTDFKDSPDLKKVQDKLHSKIGRDFNAAIQVASMLKSKNDEFEMDRLIKPLVSTKSLQRDNPAGVFVSEEWERV